MKYVTVLLIDLAAIGTWGFLACHFEHWWIMLFSVLCMVVCRENED